MKKKRNIIDSQGFSLVEFSIVLIIVGFIISGIVVGSSLITQTAISTVIRDMQTTQTAYNNFFLRFEAKPGDYPYASSYWVNCADVNFACNGNGNRIIEYSTIQVGPNGLGDETVRVYRHLALANMATGAGANQLLNGISGGNLMIGNDVPASKITGAGFFIVGPIQDIGNGNPLASPWYGDNKTNAVFIGVKKPFYGIVFSALTADDAFNIDKKIDDGVVNSAYQSVGATTGLFRSIDGADVNQFDCQSNDVYTTQAEKLACVSGFSLD